jgi:hypothetical protein
MFFSLSSAMVMIFHLQVGGVGMGEGIVSRNCRGGYAARNPAPAGF